MQAYGIGSAEELVNYFGEEDETFRRIRKSVTMTEAEKELFERAGLLGQGIIRHRKAE